MDHVAIMKKEWNLLPRILTGQKKIESRWYKAKFAPWNKVTSGDTIYFKDAGERVTVVAQVEKVKQFDNLDRNNVERILTTYGKDIDLNTLEYTDYYEGRKYCILIWLKTPQKVEVPFKIDKTGFGNACAWMVVENIKSVLVN